MKRYRQFQHVPNGRRKSIPLSVCRLLADRPPFPPKTPLSLVYPLPPSPVRRTFGFVCCVSKVCRGRPPLCRSASPACTRTRGKAPRLNKIRTTVQTNQSLGTVCSRLALSPLLPFPLRPASGGSLPNDRILFRGEKEKAGRRGISKKRTTCADDSAGERTKSRFSTLLGNYP